MLNDKGEKLTYIDEIDDWPKLTTMYGIGEKQY